MVGAFQEQRLNWWTRVKMQECYYQVRQEDDERKSIAHHILQKGTDFQRWIIAPVGGRRGVTLSYACPHCQRVLIEGLHPVGFNEAREESSPTGGPACGGQYDWREREESLGHTGQHGSQRGEGVPGPRPTVQTKCAPSGSWQPISREVTVLC